MQNEPISLLINLLPTLLVAGLGWYAVHYLSSHRDRRNAERMVRLTELKKAHNTLIQAAMRRNLTGKNSDGSVSRFYQEFEEGISTIQLYGTKEHVRLCNNLVKDLSDKRAADFTALTNELRDHIRRALGLENLQGPSLYLRIDVLEGGSGKPVSRS